MSAVEEAFIGSCILDNSKIGLVDVSPEEFSDNELKHIWSVMLTGCSDPASLSDKLGSDFSSLLASCVSQACESAFLKHAKAIKEDARRNVMIASLYDGISKLENGADVDSIVIESLSGDSDYKSIADITTDAYKRLQDGNKNKFIPSGFTSLDNVTGGFERKTLTIIAGRPGSGKSSLAFSMAMSIATTHGVLLNSLEMDEEALAHRFMSSISKMDLRLLRTGRIVSKEAWSKAADATTKLCSLNLYIDDHPKRSAAQIAARVKRHAAKNHVDILFLDYVGLLESDGDKKKQRHLQIGEMTRTLRGLAKELNIAVVLLAQLNRDADGQKPKLSHLRESGSIEQDADVILFPYREQQGMSLKESALLIVGKHRGGPVCEIPMIFDAANASYREVA